MIPVISHDTLTRLIPAKVLYIFMLTVLRKSIKRNKENQFPKLDRWELQPNLLRHGTLTNR